MVREGGPRHDIRNGYGPATSDTHRCLYACTQQVRKGPIPGQWQAPPGNIPYGSYSVGLHNEHRTGHSMWPKTLLHWLEVGLSASSNPYWTWQKTHPWLVAASNAHTCRHKCTFGDSGRCHSQVVAGASQPTRNIPSPEALEAGSKGVVWCHRIVSALCPDPSKLKNGISGC